jgi:hypothetical protein
MEANMSTIVPTMLTIGQIAHRLGQPIHRVEYLIRARGIRPCGWAGNARVFPEEAFEIIAAELQRIANIKGGDQAKGRDC